MTSLAELAPAAQHRMVAATFTERARATVDWDVPAPVDGWTARDVVGHLVEWFPAFVRAGAGVELPAGPPVADDPAAAWLAQVDAVQALLDDPATPDRTLSNPHIGEVPLDRAVAQFYTPDVFMHTWDLARATGQDETLDAGFCAMLLEGMRPVEEAIRASGQYGPAVDVGADAPVQHQLLGFIGRKP